MSTNVPLQQGGDVRGKLLANGFMNEHVPVVIAPHRKRRPADLAVKQAVVSIIAVTSDESKSRVVEDLDGEATGGADVVALTMVLLFVSVLFLLPV